MDFLSWVELFLGVVAIIGLGFLAIKLFKSKSLLYAIVITAFTICTLYITVSIPAKNNIEELNYRSKNSPTIKDVNDGYAKVVITHLEHGVKDSIVYLMWVGTNQFYERNINEIEKTNYYKKQHEK